MSGIGDWVTFWDNPHSIYVNARHFDVHYRDIAAGIVKLLPGSGPRVLDFGCGEATHAGTVAARTATLFLCESAASVRANLTRRFAGIANIRVIAPEDAAAMPPGSLDVIVANSVIQYLTVEQFGALLAQWRRLLSPEGYLIVGDVIPPNVSMASDIAALLRYAWRNGFLLAAFGGLVRTLVSDYRAIRNKLGITCYTEPELLLTLRKAGFHGARLPVNLEHNPVRMTFRAWLKAN